MVCATGDDTLRANLVGHCGLVLGEGPVESNQACTRFEIGCKVVKLGAVLSQMVVPEIMIIV